MASTLQLVVETIRMNDYVSLVVATAVGYDYILTLSDEIEYIWHWTPVSTLFVFTRYFGLCYVMMVSFLGSSFLPGPAKTYVFKSHLALINDDARKLIMSKQLHIQGYILYGLSIWASFIFFAAAEFAMILRVWALYTRSKFIFGTLLTSYTIEIIPYLIMCIMVSSQGQSLAGTAQVLDYSFCVQQYTPVTLTILVDSAQIALGALMCLLVIIQFTKDSVQTYKVTKQFRLNRYTSLLVREGMIYFLAVLTYALINMLAGTASFPTDKLSAILIGAIEYIPPLTLVPRFILNLRALYARDLQGRRGSEIDTAFGLTSVSGYHDGAAGGAIKFADARQNEDLEGDDEIRMEIGGGGDA